MIAQIAVAGMLAVNAGAPVDSVSTIAPAADAWFSPDKAKHFVIAGFTESVAFASLESAGASRNSSFTVAIAATAAVSILREVHDGRVKKQFSFRDLAWDMAGGLAAFLVLRHTERP
jgi:uncharacterized protein YfiM (DUF2279 family)